MKLEIGNIDFVGLGCFNGYKNNYETRHVNIVNNFKLYRKSDPNKNEKLQIMYGINGEKILTEKKLDHLSGFMDSKPVRVGNAAYFQKQKYIWDFNGYIHFQILKFQDDNINMNNFGQL